MPKNSFVLNCDNFYEDIPEWIRNRSEKQIKYIIKPCLMDRGFSKEYVILFVSYENPEDVFTLRKVIGSVFIFSVVKWILWRITKTLPIGLNTPSISEFCLTLVASVRIYLTSFIFSLWFGCIFIKNFLKS